MCELVVSYLSLWWISDNSVLQSLMGLYSLSHVLNQYCTFDLNKKRCPFGKTHNWNNFGPVKWHFNAFLVLASVCALGSSFSCYYGKLKVSLLKSLLHKFLVLRHTNGGPYKIATIEKNKSSFRWSRNYFVINHFHFSPPYSKHPHETWSLMIPVYNH